MEFDRRTRQDRAARAAAHNALGPGKRTLTAQLSVQRSEPRAAPDADAADPAHVHAAAARGTGTPATKLPHADQIQRLFGRHDISGVQAHVGGEAAASARAMGARAYATGEHVVLGEAADLHTVAHEAAHVVQQRGGIQLKGGVGSVGDAHEQHADAVADRVVQGDSAADLLAAPPGAARRGLPGGSACAECGGAPAGSGDCPTCKAARSAHAPQPDPPASTTAVGAVQRECDPSISSCPDDAEASSEPDASYAPDASSAEPAASSSEPDASYPPLGAGIAVPGGSGPGTPGGPDPCFNLLQAIIDQLELVAELFTQAQDDKNNLYRDHRTLDNPHPDGRSGSWDGHRQQYDAERRELRRRIAEWDANDDCGNFQLDRQQQEDLDDAREYGDKEFPSKPLDPMFEGNEDAAPDTPYEPTPETSHDSSLWDQIAVILVGAGLSVALIAEIIADLADPEPATKMASLGLTVVTINAILALVGKPPISLPGDDDVTSTVDPQLLDGGQPAGDDDPATA